MSPGSSVAPGERDPLGAGRHGDARLGTHGLDLARRAPRRSSRAAARRPRPSQTASGASTTARALSACAAREPAMSGRGEPTERRGSQSSHEQRLLRSRTAAVNNSLSVR